MTEMMVPSEMIILLASIDRLSDRLEKLESELDDIRDSVAHIQLDIARKETDLAKSNVKKLLMIIAAGGASGVGVQRLLHILFQ